MARRKSGRGAVVGVFALVFFWIGFAVWFYLPFMNPPTAFPRMAFRPPVESIKPDPIVETGGSTGERPISVRFGSSIDAFVTQDRGYSVVQSDFGIRGKLYTRHDYRAAQEEADKLYANRNEGRAGSIYSGFLNSLGLLGQEENVDGMISTLKAWQQAYPTSQYPLMVEAILRMNLAEAIRSGTWSSTVSRAAMLGFDSNIRQAKKLLDEAQEKRPDDPHPSIYLMQVGEALNLPTEQIDTYFAYAHERSPQCYAMWARKLKFLAPQWGGSWRDMNEFMRQAENAAKTNPQVELTVVDGLVEMHQRGVTGISLSSPDQWRQVADIYDRVLNAYPDDLEILTLYANRAANFCPDPHEVAQIFDRIGDQYFEGGIWDSLDQYNQARTHAYVEYASKTDGDESVSRINKAFELSPDDWYVAYHFGVSRGEVGDYKNALNALLRAVNTNPSFVPAINATAHVYLHMGDFENAEIYAKRALVREPTGKRLFEAEALLSDAKATSHADAGQPIVEHSY